MKSGELAEWLRGAMDRIDPTYNAAGQRADIALSMSDHLPLILAALDLAAADLEYAGRKGHVERYIEKTKARKALRRAEEE